MIVLRDYQQQTVLAVINFFTSGKKGNPLVVVPTAGGKSYIMSGFCKYVLEKWPGQKILIVSDTKEILKQDHDSLKKHLGIEAGIYSAGLKSKTLKQITVAGIQSIYNKPEIFNQFNVILVDECHKIPHGKDGIYHKFFNQVKKRVIGLTATPFRTGGGFLHKGEGAFFSEIAYEVYLRDLLDEGYVCKLTSKGTKTRLDPAKKKIKKQAGDYIVKELSLEFDRVEITKNIVSELLSYKDLRKKWLLFAIDIKHAENITRELNAAGIKTACVHSKMKSGRDEIVNEFKKDNSIYQALVSVAVLTTGFDCPAVDLIGLIRPTSSPVLHIQIIGRGLRIANGKENCLVLDFAGNLGRLGPIDDPLIKVKGKGTGEAIMKECEVCFEIVHAAVRICPECNTPFKFKHKLSTKTGNREVLTIYDWHDIDNITYKRTIGRQKIPMLMVTYVCGRRRFSEYILFEHTGYALTKARKWWSERSNRPFPKTAQEALNFSNSLKEPVSIRVKEAGKYPDIKKYNFSIDK